MRAQQCPRNIEHPVRLSDNFCPTCGARTITIDATGSSQIAQELEYQCQNCQRQYYEPFNYCGFCGHKMGKEV